MSTVILLSPWQQNQMAGGGATDVMPGFDHRVACCTIAISCSVNPYNSYTGASIPA